MSTKSQTRPQVSISAATGSLSNTNRARIDVTDRNGRKIQSISVLVAYTEGYAARVKAIRSAIYRLWQSRTTGRDADCYIFFNWLDFDRNYAGPDVPEMAAGRSREANGQQAFDPDSGEILLDVEASAAERDEMSGIFEEAEGRSDDGSITVPTMTMSRINSNPERAKLNSRRTLISTWSGAASKLFIAETLNKDQSFVGLAGDFVAINWLDDKEHTPPVAGLVYKSDRLFFPIGQESAIMAFERKGSLTFSIAFYAEPASNPRGYQWIARNLAKLDRNNLSPIDRLMELSQHATLSLEKRMPLLITTQRELPGVAAKS